MKALCGTGELRPRIRQHCATAGTAAASIHVNGRTIVVRVRVGRHVQTRRRSQISGELRVRDLRHLGAGVVSGLSLWIWLRRGRGPGRGHLKISHLRICVPRLALYPFHTVVQRLPVCAIIVLILHAVPVTGRITSAGGITGTSRTIHARSRRRWSGRMRVESVQNRKMLPDTKQRASFLRVRVELGSDCV